ncbi:MAG: hypothetical protein ABI158_02165, partial [Edaphobacter sp.]
AGPWARAQWRMQSSGTTAGLRGIHAVDADIAWASGTNGTVLRTVDGGQHWQGCNVPPNAGRLDLRSVWAWDADHAMVMSSGPGTESRLYSTQDGCRNWRLIFTNPDAKGFWDALQFEGTHFGVILGDPIDGRFALFATYDGGTRWTRQVDPCLETVARQQGAFAASNQALAVLPIEDADAPSGFAASHAVRFGTSDGWLYELQLAPLHLAAAGECVHARVLPGSTKGNASAGIFALAFRDGENGVAVGGDYTKPQASAATAAYTSDGDRWHLAQHPPKGYRSAVAWNRTGIGTGNGSDGSWIAAGPGGSDISRDGGRSWQRLDGGNWNALSLPFAVGPNGRIGRLISWGELRAANGMPRQRAIAAH